jgi:hypothetical protein
MSQKSTVVVIQIEPDLEGAVSHPPLVLKQIEHLGQNGVERHGRSSAWAWGSLQDVPSMGGVEHFQAQVARLP